MSFPSRAVLVASALALTLACGLPEEEGSAAPGTTQQEIIGGSSDPNDPAVVALAQYSGGQFYEFCTGTLVAPRTVLSAGHCVDPQVSNGAYVVFGPSVSSPTQYVAVAQPYQHPNYNPSNLNNDVSVWKLQTAVTNVTPLPMNATALTQSDVGRTVRHVGYGVSNGYNQTGSGLKREVTYTIRSLPSPSQSTQYESGASGQQTCNGDSGGPALAIMPGSTTESVIGTVSWGDANCVQQGWDNRVDLMLNGFILPTMNQWEGPTCAEDGQCKAGCTPVDPDCVCAQDGTCNPQCPDLTKDPDCPKDCVQNNVCALDACPLPDPDCVALGQSCTSDLQCNPHDCIGDPQHSGTYCSKPCSSSSQCPGTMECSMGFCRFPQRPTANPGDPCDAETFCLADTECNGPSFDDLRCQVPCEGAGAGCPGSTQTCTQGVTGLFYCAQQQGQNGGPTEDGGTTMGSHDNGNQLVIVPRAQEQGELASGCSATGGTPAFWAGLLALGAAMLRRRRAAVLRRHRAALTTIAVSTMVAASLVGCGPTTEVTSPAEGPTPDQLAQLRRPILGGTVDNGDPEVFELAMYYSNNQGAACTGTLIAPHTILTAAHCADPREAGASSVQIWVMNKTSDQTAGQGDWIAVDNARTRIHPDWDMNSLEGDMALLYLTKVPSVTPKPWSTTSLSGTGGKAVRSVGYGITSATGQDSGTKHTVGLVVDQIDSDGIHFYVGDQVSKGICHGDSGGPTFMTFGDGVERVIGVHSFDANGQCTIGGVIRVDAYQSFITKWMADYEGPTCAQDGLCKSGCTPVDVDCYCVKDNVCNPMCPDLAMDPDCPKDCVKNNVCSTQACPVPDQDCVAEGNTCSSELQCMGRVCISDPQHPTFYCSRPCTKDTDCLNGMECVPGANVCRYVQLPTAAAGEACTPGETFCTNKTVCTGPQNGGDTHCETACATNADCSGKATCEYGQGTVKYCQTPYVPPVVVARAKEEGMPMAQGCAAAGGSPLLLLGALSLLRRRRAKR